MRGYRLWTVTTATMAVVSAALLPILLANAAELVSGWGIVATAVWLRSRHCGRPEEYAASDEFRRHAASE